MFPHVSKTGRTQQRIAHGMEQNICIGMAQKSLVKRDGHAPKNQPAPLHQPVNVVSGTDSHGLAPFFGRVSPSVFYGKTVEYPISNKEYRMLKAFSQPFIIPCSVFDIRYSEDQARSFPALRDRYHG
jgi:hypothetical protein